MPVTDMSFEDGIFFSREVGCVDGEDARVWAEALTRCAHNSPAPLVILIDALAATSITSDARRIFARAAETPNVRVAAIASNNPRVMQQSRITALLGAGRSSHETHFFTSLQEAAQFASNHSTPPAYSG